MTARIANVAQVAVSQVLPSAYAAPAATFEFSEVKGAGDSDSPILVSTLNGRTTYIKSSMPFSNDSSSAPTIVSGSTIEETNQMFAKAKLSKLSGQLNAASGNSNTDATSSSKVNSGGSDAPQPSISQRSSAAGRLIGESHKLSQNPKRSSEPSRSPSTVDEGNKLKTFTKALVQSDNPIEFLNQNLSVLRQLQIQVIVDKKTFPEKPTYRVLRRYSFAELQKWAKP